jgi:hypothetical protein
VNLGGTLLGAALLILSAGMLLIFARPNKKRAPISLRRMSAIDNLHGLIGAAMEQGTRIHIGLGSGSIGKTNYGSTLAGLNTLESITRTTLLADQAPIATSGDGATSLLGEDAIRAVYRKESAIDKVPLDGSQLSGVTPLAYAAGTLPEALSPDTSANLLVGRFGAEAAFLVPSEPVGASHTLGSTDSLPGQAVLFNATENTLVGEEIFALPVYLDQKPVMLASLMVQDLLRLILIFGMVIGVILVIAGLI